MEPMMLKVEEAAAAAQVSRATGYTLVATGEWPSVRVASRLRVPVEGLRSWIRANSTGGTTATNDAARLAS